jgi:hypothetical protein
MAVVRVTPTKNSGKYLGKLSIVLLHDAIDVCSTTVKLSTSHTHVEAAVNKPSKQSSHLKPVSHAWLSGTGKLASDFEPEECAVRKRKMANKRLDKGMQGGGGGEAAYRRLQMLQRPLHPL